MRQGASSSIHRRIALHVLGTTAVSLTLACVAFVAYDLSSLKRSMLRETETLAGVVELQGAIALAFLDVGTGEEALGTLAATEAVTAAVLYDRGGTPFAHFAREESARDFEAPPLAEVGHSFGDGALELFRPVRFEGEPVGTLFLRRHTNELAERASLYGALGLGVLLLVAAVASFTSRRLGRSVAQPLAAVAEASEAVARGDLRTRVPGAGEDEIGRVARTFNHMADSLQELLSSARQSIEKVATVTAALEDSSGSLTRAAERQRRAIEEASASVDRVVHASGSIESGAAELADTAATTSDSVSELDATIADVAGHMEELARALETASGEALGLAQQIDRVSSEVETLDLATRDSGARLGDLHSSVEEVARNAGESQRLTRDSREAARRGSDSVRETVTAMNEISGAFDSVRAQVTRLRDRSEEIGQILKVIGGITEQTNLLALNAAIIAAGAGEHGRAFAVVADEVRSLADGTGRATRQIEEIISGVQQETRAAVEVVAAGSEKVGSGVVLSQEALSSLDEIRERSARSAECADEIAAATDRQSTDLAQVDQAFLQVKDKVESILGITRSQRRATGEITSLVEQVRTLGQQVSQSAAGQRKESRSITTAVESVADRSARIAESTRAEAESSEAIRRALLIFRDVTEETSSRSAAIDEMVRSLSSLSGQLEREIDRFKTG